MKKTFKIILAIMFSVLSLCAISFGAEKPSAPSAYADEEIIEAKLLYNPTCVTASNNYIFVFDEYENLIKTYTPANNMQNVGYNCDENKNISISNVLKMEVCGDYLFVLSGDTTRTISVYDITNLSENHNPIATKNSQDVSSLDGMFNFTTYLQNENDVYVVASVFVSNTNKFYVLNFSLSANPVNFTNSIAEYTPNLNDQTQLTSLALAPNSDDNLLTLLFNMGAKVYNFGFNPTTQGSTSQNTQEIELELTENVLSLNRIKKETTNYMVVSTQSTLKLYTETTDSTYALSSVSDTDTTLSGERYFGNNSADLFVTSTTEKQIIRFSLNNNSPVTFASETLVENGALAITALSAENLEFFRATNASAVVLESPFSQTPLYDLNLNDYVVRVARVNFGNSELLDYYYCLFVGNTSNIYGYVKAEYLTKISASNPPKTTILINADSHIYSLPTTFVDNSGDVCNQINLTTTQIIPATMLSSGVNNLDTQKPLYLVKTKNNVVGFIRANSEYTPSGSKKLVKNNATAIKETIVYDSDDGNGEIIDTLSEGTRVKINDNQKTNAKYVKITYSDSYGIERTGYVLSENLKTDAWSVLRIIGLVLVGLNVVFLVVLLVVKKRVNHD